MSFLRQEKFPWVYEEQPTTKVLWRVKHTWIQLPGSFFDSYCIPYPGEESKDSLTEAPSHMSHLDKSQLSLYLLLNLFEGVQLPLPFQKFTLCHFTSMKDLYYYLFLLI